MNAYVYRAAWYCQDCIREIRNRISTEDTGDSNDFPQGPYANGGGESDSPQHCDKCHVFLENPLTTDGYDYVEERIADSDADSVAVTIWKPFYNL